MVNGHFLKTLMIFTAMIALGLIGVLLVSFFEDPKNTDTNMILPQTENAK